MVDTSPLVQKARLVRLEFTVQGYSLDLLLRGSRQGPASKHLPVQLPTASPPTERKYYIILISNAFAQHLFPWLAGRRSGNLETQLKEKHKARRQHSENSNYACAEVLSCYRLGFHIRPKAQRVRPCVRPCVRAVSLSSLSRLRANSAG